MLAELGRSTSLSKKLMPACDALLRKQLGYCDIISNAHSTFAKVALLTGRGNSLGRPDKLLLQRDDFAGRASHCEMHLHKARHMAWHASTRSTVPVRGRCSSAVLTLLNLCHDAVYILSSSALSCEVGWIRRHSAPSCESSILN